MKALWGIVGVLLLAGATLFVGTPKSKPRPAESLAALGPELGVVFPPSTRLIGVLRQNGMDDWIAAKVTMSRGDWPAFLASTTLDDSRLAGGEGGLLGPDQTFWERGRTADAAEWRASRAPVRRPRRMPKYLLRLGFLPPT